jgi:hypothetical protein
VSPSENNCYSGLCCLDWFAASCHMRAERRERPCKGGGLNLPNSWQSLSTPLSPTLRKSDWRQWVVNGALEYQTVGVNTLICILLVKCPLIFLCISTALSTPVSTYSLFPLSLNKKLFGIILYSHSTRISAISRCLAD